MTKKPKPPTKYDIGRTLPLKTHSSAPAGPRAIQTPPTEPRRLKRRIFTALVGVLILVVLFFGTIATWDAINIARAMKATFGSGNLFSLASPAPLKGAGSGRVNILLVGYSADDPGHPGADLTDSIMLMSLSTSSPTGYMLSIPRDLYVHIPGFGYGKINEAYKDGGMGLLEQIITTDLKTPINYYGLINYAAVRDSVNALGGIWVNIKSSDPRGLFDPNINTADGGPLTLTNGWHKLNGQTALNLVRARGDPCGCGQYAYGFPNSDFDRTAHQRQVIDAIKNRLSWTLILNPLKNGRLFSAIGKNIKTDVKAANVRPLFSLFRRTPQSSLASLSLNDINGHNYLTSYSSYYAGSALIPAAGLDDYDQIDTVLAQLNQ